MNDVLIGIMSGFIQTLVGHPFDTWKTWIQTKQKFSVNSLYRGYKMALASSISQNILVFSCYDIFHNHFPSSNPFINGMISGLVGSFIVSPFERYKCLEQIHQNNYPYYQDIWKGTRLTIIRDMGGFGIYFGTYKELKNNNYSSFTAGGISGLLSWVYSYPIDVVKTRYQCNQLYSNHHLYKGFGIVAFRSILVNSCIFYSIDSIFPEKI